MSGSFHCPKCNASYQRDKRRVGKAVVCTCGHRFLVPPLDYAAPPSSTPSDASLTPQPRRAQPPAERPKPLRPKARPAQPKARTPQSSDSVAEALPVDEPITPPAGTVRWADPVDAPQPAPLMEAEVVHPGAPVGQPQDLTGSLFSQGGAYGDALGSHQPPLVAEPLPALLTTKPPKKGKKKGQTGSRFSDWVAYAVLFLFLPGSALCTLIALFLPAPSPGQAVARPGGIAPGRAVIRQPAPPSPPPRAANEPPPSGYPITLWNAVKRKSGEFSVDYRQDRGTLDSSRQYYWVVRDSNGKIEFPIPAGVWKQRDKLSGKPAAAAPGQFMGPYATFIEEQVGTSRNRISNDVQVTIAP